VDQLHARASAVRLIGLQIGLQATILAFRDAFILTTAIVACGVVLALFLRSAQRDTAGSSEPVVME
jgi:hypothetical protein